MCTDQAAPELAELGNRVIEKRNAESWWLSLLGSPSKVRVWKFVLNSAFRAFPPGLEQKENSWENRVTVMVRVRTSFRGKLGERGLIREVEGLKNSPRKSVSEGKSAPIFM